MSFPLDWIRAQFPALRSGEVYLDNAAGSQVPQRVADAVSHTLLHVNANRGGVHRASVEITGHRQRIRERTAQFLNAESDAQVAFGLNATNLITLLSSRFGADGEIIVTGLDHHANIDPWKATGAVIREWPVRMPDATLHTQDLEPLLTSKTRLVCVTAASNALGTMPDIRAAAELAHAAGAQIFVDAVAATPHVLPDVRGLDYLVFSPYKVFGPHLGVLYLRDPQSVPAPKLEFLPADDPIAWEPGTQNHEAIAGWGAVLDYLDELALQARIFASGREAWARVFAAAARHEGELTQRMLTGLRALGAELYGMPGTSGRTATVSFNMPGRTAQDTAARLAASGVAVAAGHSYAYGLVMRTLGLADRGGLVRASAVHYNCDDDIDRLLEGLA